MGRFSFKSLVIGEPLTLAEMAHEKLTKVRALAVFSSDALSSVAYATEEILLVLVVLGGAAMDWSFPIALAICALLFILLVSYRQTIYAYPNGGGAYIVSKENLGVMPGLIAGSALLLDYLLTVSVSICAGIAALTSAFPGLKNHTVLLCLVAIWLVVVANLRGLKESAKIFAVPTYAFIFSILALLGVGFFKAATGSLLPDQSLQQAIKFDYTNIGLLFILRAFSSGCAALTGVEAVSNGVPSFKSPQSRNAVVTLVWMAFLLGIMFLGLTTLAHLLHIHPTEETVVSQIARGVFGTTWIYYFIQGATMLILVLAANTAFNGFPLLASMLAADRFLPRQLSNLGDRLVFSNGILILGFFASVLVVVFGGDTHALVPLYAVGVFVSFTLSQAGMVVRFWKTRPRHWQIAMTINAIGALTTFVVLQVIAITKFMHGAWIVVFLIPAMIVVLKKINNHYLSLGRQLATTHEDYKDVAKPLDTLVIIPVSNLHKGMVRSIRFAHSISKDVVAVSVDIAPEATKRLQGEWEAVKPGIPLVILPSPFRSLSEPLLEYITKAIDNSIAKEKEIILVVPEFVTARWWHNFLHNQTAVIIRTYLWFKYPELVVTSVRHRLTY